MFETLKKELPYCCEVRVDEFKDPKEKDKKKVIRIKATVHVERESQKKIVILVPVLFLEVHLPAMSFHP